MGFVNCESLEYSPRPPPFSQLDEKKTSTNPKAQKEAGESPYQVSLLQAIWKEDVAGVKEFLGKGADPNAFTSTGTTPLLIAAKKKNPQLMQILVEKGAKVDWRDKDGITPLMAAVSAGLVQNVRTLITAGANVNAKDTKGFTPLMWATAQGFPQVVEILLAYGADVNLKTPEGLNVMGLSKRITADLQRSLADAQKKKDQKNIAKLKKSLAQHEQVFQLLEKGAGKKERLKDRFRLPSDQCPWEKL